MTRNANRKGAANSRLIGFALTTALATAALTGCAASAPPAALSASKAEAQLAKGNYSKAIEHAEAAVTADPRNGAYRAVLGAAYLEAGRFGSAAASFQDAIDLGETSPRNALSLALALTAEGKQPAALKVLKDWEGSIAAGDLGLAYSLAGAPDRGIAVLTNALRNGDNTAKTRQNLAYSFALAGQWKEARVMAAEDIPVDRVSDRIAEWAAEVHPDLYRTRVASLLEVPAAEYDPGQPVQLALANFPSAEQLAVQAAAQPAPQPAPAAQVASARAGPAGLLPVGDPVDARAAAPQPARQPTVARQTPGAAPSNVASAPVPASASAPRATAFAAPQPAPAVAQASAPRAATPSVAPAAARTATPSVTPAPARAATPAVASSAARAVAPVLSEASGAASGSHLVQLGSFSSEKGARRAWDIYVSRYPELASRDMVITRAVVRGKEYYRVAAAGYDAGSSRAMCGRVNRASPDGCIAYAANNPLPGAVDNGRRFAMK